jgi:hypothetical protein
MATMVVAVVRVLKCILMDRVWCFEMRVNVECVCGL